MDHSLTNPIARGSCLYFLSRRVKKCTRAKKRSYDRVSRASSGEIPAGRSNMDDVPIPLRPAFKSPHPSDYDVLTAIEKRVRALKAG